VQVFCASACGPKPSTAWNRHHWATDPFSHAWISVTNQEMPWSCSCWTDPIKAGQEVQLPQRISNEGCCRGLCTQRLTCVEEAHCSRLSPYISFFHISVTPDGIDLMGYLGLRRQLCLLYTQAKGQYSCRSWIHEYCPCLFVSCFNFFGVNLQLIMCSAVVPVYQSHMNHETSACLSFVADPHSSASVRRQ